MFRRGLFYTFLSIYLRYYLGLTVTETTLFATIPMVLSVIFQMFVWGTISDKLQIRRTLIIIGEVLAGFGSLLVWYLHRSVENLRLAGYIIIIGLSIVEIFWSMSNIGWSALISDLYPLKDRNAIQGRLQSIGGIGRIIGVLIGGMLYDLFNKQFEGWGFYEGPLFFVAAGVMFLSTIPMIFMPEGGVKNETESDNLVENGEAQYPLRIFYIFIAAMIFINFGRNSIAVIFPQYMVLDTGFGISSEALSYLVNTQSAAVIIIGFTAGGLGRKIGNGYSLLLATTASIISLVIFAVANKIGWVYGSNFMMGAARVIIMASSYALASQLIPPARRARLFGIYNATLFLSWGLSATLITGPIIDLLISTGRTEVFAYRMSFVVSAALSAIGLIIFGILYLVIIPKYRRVKRMNK